MSSSPSPSHPPRFIYLVGCTGVYCLLTALCGLVGVKRDRRAHLSAYIALMALLVLWEAGATSPDADRQLLEGAHPR